VGPGGEERIDYIVEELAAVQDARGAGHVGGILGQEVRNGEVNGERVEPEMTDGLLSLRRTWTPSDTVEVTLPMSPRTEPMPDDPDRVAVLYGPIVLAGTLGTEGTNRSAVLTATDTWRALRHNSVVRDADGTDWMVCHAIHRERPTRPNG
jgi:DUF1680 family protein